MRAGAYEYRIKILKRIVERNEYNEQETSYEVIRQTRANVKQVNGQRTDNYEVFYEYTTVFTVHKYVELDEFDRIEFKGNQYRILSIDEDRHMNQKVITTQLINE